MRAGGYEPEDFEGDIVEVWPENWPAWRLFIHCQTQWHVAGMGSRTGLIYTSLYPLLDRVAEDADRWDELFNEVRSLEAAALNQMKDDAEM